MKMSRFVRATVAFGATVACVVALAACTNSSSTSQVAATVDGEEIAEQTVTDQIQTIRGQSGLSEEEEWGTFLAQNSMTPSSVREQIIDSMVHEKLMVKGAADLGITVEDSEVNEYVDQMKANYSDDAAWSSALEQAGFTEDSYREVIKQSLYEQKVNEYFQDNAEMSDEDYVESARQYATYYDGAKRSSHILFKVDDPNDEAAMAEAEAKAEELLARINSGEIDFADAATQYSEDTGSAAQGGDVGWDLLSSFVTEYTDALDTLELNQVSGPVKSQFGVHIIKVTDVYTAPEDTSTITSLDQIPAEFQDTIKNMAASVGANNKYQEWLEGLEENASIEIKDMPSGLPYDVDMSKYETASDSSSADDAETVEIEETDEATEAESSSATAEAESSSAAAEAEPSSSSSAAA